MVPLQPFHPVKPLSRQEQITAHLREQVLSGALAPDTRLPTTAELARQWQVPIATLQAAFAPLVKEGLLARKPGVGTVVRSAAAGLTRVGIYLPSGSLPAGSDRFSERLAARLETRVAADGLQTLRLPDPRPGGLRDTPPDELLAAVRERRIDALIACECDTVVASWLTRLPLPVAISGSGAQPAAVWYDLTDFARQGVARLAERGCRRIGLITLARPAPQASAEGRPCDLHGALAETATRLGLEADPAWRRWPAPGTFIDEVDAERWGFVRAQELWAQADRPDGLLVYTDRVARGVVMGLLALGPTAAPPRLVLHRNAEIGLFSPLPADFLDASVTDTAERLMAMIEAQHRGQPLPSRDLAFRLSPA